jgi:hypothetical protein
MCIFGKKKKIFLFRTKERTTRATFKLKSKGNNYFPAKKQVTGALTHSSLKNKIKIIFFFLKRPSLYNVEKLRLS